MSDLGVLDGKPGGPAQTRLFCFPFAGGSAASYRVWHRLAPPGVHVSAIEYPGHGRRLAEEPVPSLTLLTKNLADLIEPLLHPPFAFFGHSMGGIVAYELTRELRARGARQPCHLFVSAAFAPGGPSNHRSLADASDEEVIEEMRRLGGTPAELLDSPEFITQAAQLLRTDSAALGAYRHRAGAPLPVPITVFGGRGDELVPVSFLRRWSALTCAGFRLQLFPGGHFFLFPSAREVLAAVTKTLGCRQDLLSPPDRPRPRDVPSIYAAEGE